MKTVEKKFEVYEIQELKNFDENAFNKAYEHFINVSEYSWHDDNVNTLQEFCNFFNLNLTGYRYDQYLGSVDFEFDNDISKMRYTRLWNYINKNFDLDIISGKKDLTGYCMDYDIFAPVVNFLKKPTDITFKELIQDCMDCWISECCKDYEYSLSEEAFIDYCEVNECLFLVDGEEFFDC